MRTPGIHHVTAIGGDVVRLVRFYREVLGLPLVKRTVNFDDPGTWHLYFADRTGRPGTVLTFFAWSGMPRGRPGAGQVTTTRFAVPPGSLGRWLQRLDDAAVERDDPEERKDGSRVALRDPDGLRLELLEQELPGRDVPADGPVDPAMAIGGFDGVTLTVTDPGPTERLLVDGLGMEPAGEEDGVRVLRTDPAAPGSRIELRAETTPGRVAVGSVHHVAWRAAGEEEQRVWRDALLADGHRVTPVIDRNYFRSIYFREPGGILFEIATDPPGFTVDETLETLGGSLQLPPWLESRREEIAAALPPLPEPRAERS